MQGMKIGKTHITLTGTVREEFFWTNSTLPTMLTVRGTGKIAALGSMYSTVTVYDKRTVRDHATVTSLMIFEAFTSM
jgi:hypothetical protein